MKPQFQKKIAFIARSMMWSLLLYVVMMLAFNWDEIGRTINGKNAVAIVTDTPEQQIPYPGTPARIAAPAGILRGIVAVVRTISGFTAVAAR